MKRKSQIDRAIESIELDIRDIRRHHSAELDALNAKYTGRMEGLEASIVSLRAQKAQPPARKPRTRPVEVARPA